VHVFVSFPALEHAPDRWRRAIEMLRVIDVPLANDAEPVADGDVDPRGSEVTRSPLRRSRSPSASRPDGGPGGLTSRRRPRRAPALAVIGPVSRPHGDRRTVKVPLVEPARPVTLAGTVAAAVLLLESDTRTHRSSRGAQRRGSGRRVAANHAGRLTVTGRQRRGRRRGFTPSARQRPCCREWPTVGRSSWRRETS